MVTMDAKLSAACEAIISGSLAADIHTAAEAYLDKHETLFSGARKLRMIYKSFATSGKKGRFLQLC